jgi:hypothetical protein
MRPESISGSFAVALPAFTLLLAFGTIGASCGIAWELGHIPPWPPVSMCGMYPPERYIFSLGLTRQGTHTNISSVFPCNHDDAAQKWMESVP